MIKVKNIVDVEKKLWHKIFYTVDFDIWNKLFDMVGDFDDALYDIERHTFSQMMLVERKE